MYLVTSGHRQTFQNYKQPPQILQNSKSFFSIWFFFSVKNIGLCICLSGTYLVSCTKNLERYLTWIDLGSTTQQTIYSSDGFRRGRFLHDDLTSFLMIRSELKTLLFDVKRFDEFFVEKQVTVTHLSSSFCKQVTAQTNDYPESITKSNKTLLWF